MEGCDTMNEIRMPDINNVVIAGNLTRDPAFRKTTNGTPVANFWIASNRRFKDNNGNWRENVCYVGVVAWYKLAENCAENLKKGSAVIIEGELQSRTLRSEEGRNRSIVEIKAHRIQFLNRKEQLLDESDEISEQNKASEKKEETAGETPKPEKKQENTHSEDEKPNPLSGKFDYGYQDLEK
jgi:single-strand DNA-binding protein